jgi:hypothetical protein
MGNHTRDGSGGGQRCHASSTKVGLRIERLRHHLGSLIREMRMCMSSLCGTTENDGDEVMRQMVRLRQKMRATRRRIMNLRFQDGARN